MIKKAVALIVFLVAWCVVEAFNIQREKVHKESIALSDSTLARFNYFLPLRNDEYAPTMEQLTDPHYKNDYARIVLPGKVRGFYVVDTVHIHDYYILENKDNISFLITNKNKIGEEFDYENPLSNPGCYLTDGCFGGNFELWSYYCGPLDRVLEFDWPKNVGHKKQLPHGYRLYGPLEGGKEIYSKKDDEIPLFIIPHVFAVFLIKGTVYNHYFIGILDWNKDKPFDFLDENGYYTLLIPIYDEEKYKKSFNRMLWGDYGIGW